MNNHDSDAIRAADIIGARSLYDVKVAFSGYNDRYTDYHWESDASFQRNMIVVTGTIFCNGTEDVGTFERHLYRSGGFTCAYHDHIIVRDTAHRRKNNAFQIYRSSLRFYDEVGIRFIHLFADEMGPFVWPQFGAELSTLDFKTDLVKILAERGVTDPQYLDPETLVTWTVAALHEPTQNVGSEALLALSDRRNEMLPMTLDLEDAQQREFLLEIGILEKSRRL